MNKLVTIIFLGWILLLFSCASENKNDDVSSFASETEETISANDYEEMESLIESKPNELTNEQREAFQLRAIQKFEDFLDYIKIISDPKVDTQLTKHSAKLALELFINDSITINDSLLVDSGTTMPIKGFLSMLQFQKRAIYIKAETLNFSQPLKPDSLNNYQGNIEAKIKIKKKIYTKNIDVFLVEIEKKFGKNNKGIMEVRLGNIY